MSVPKIFSAELEGIDAELVEVEADLHVGLHSFNIVGLADKAVSEAKERVDSALKNSGIKPPSKENRKITINLAPADTKKAGSRFDLAIALAYLLASEQVKPFNTTKSLFIGELSLDGTLRPISGALNVALLTKRIGLTSLFLPAQCAEEAAIVDGITIYPVKTLSELIEHIETRKRIQSLKHTAVTQAYPQTTTMSEVRGQEGAKRALTIAAAGGHNVLMSGTPGTGKTMLANALQSILPLPSLKEQIEITSIWSSAGLTQSRSYIKNRPFRAPHHGASPSAILGGGTNPRAGEISLAHRGVLFLDELPEFRRDVLEGLRQPLEEGRICVARAKKALSFPARFILIGAMNPCPCGYFESNEKECTCTAHDVLRYRKKLSGPLLDRFDIHITVPRVPIEELRRPREENDDTQFRSCVARAREIQQKRFEKSDLPIHTNSEMRSKDTELFANLSDDAELFLKKILERNILSTRGYYRILKVARTVADIESSEEIKKEHLAEAFQYRIQSD
ncbi:MAG: YifB family Mg chelatase-like AAA ATPase [Candidatus Paceibacterota bacterium]|jgi:magnesium chelatase family protein